MIRFNLVVVIVVVVVVVVVLVVNNGDNASVLSNITRWSDSILLSLLLSFLLSIMVIMPCTVKHQQMIRFNLIVVIVIVVVLVVKNGDNACVLSNFSRWSDSILLSLSIMVKMLVYCQTWADNQIQSCCYENCRGEWWCRWLWCQWWWWLWSILNEDNGNFEDYNHRFWFKMMTVMTKMNVMMQMMSMK